MVDHSRGDLFEGGNRYSLSQVVGGWEGWGDDALSTLWGDSQSGFDRNCCKIQVSSKTERGEKKLFENFEKIIEKKFRSLGAAFQPSQTNS